MEYIPRVNVVHRSLQGNAFIFGVEKPLAIMNGTLGLAASFALGNVYVIGVSVFTHMLLRNLMKKDPDIRRVYLRADAQSGTYDPWPHVVELDRTKRKPGYGKGMLC